MSGSRVFISYSHHDEEWKNRLVSHLGVLERQGRVALWVDQQIRPGDDWLREIEQAMDEAAIAVLLVSASFLSSEFISGTEVPRLLRRRAEQGLRVIPLIIRPCAWPAVKWLADLECRPKGRALSEGAEAVIDGDLASLALEIDALLGGEDAPESFEKLLAGACELLAGNRDAAAALAEQHAAWKRVFADGGGGALAAELTQRSSVDEVLIAVHKAHRASLGRPEVAHTLEQLLALIVPVLYDRQLAWTLPREAGGILLQVPVATATIAEIVMAGLDGRGYRYRPLRDARSFPEGLASVPQVPEPGIDFAGDRAFQDFLGHLAAELVAEEDRRGVRRSDIPQERRDEVLASLVDDELRWQAQDGDGLRRYFLFDSRFARDHGSVLVRLRRSLPSLRLLELTGGDLAGERRLCRPLRDLLYRSQTRGRDAEMGTDGVKH